MQSTALIEQIRHAYLINHKEHTVRHAEEVADTAAWLAEIHDLDVEKARLAALLHDISAIITPREMYDLAISRGLAIDPAEEKYNFLLHQRISKIFAHEKFGVSDPEILSAIECHTTLKKNAGPYDMAIFIADKISWDQQGHPPYYEILKTLAAGSLDAACLYYIKYQFDNNLLLMPHLWITEAYEYLKKEQLK